MFPIKAGLAKVRTKKMDGCAPDVPLKMLAPGEHPTTFGIIATTFEGGLCWGLTIAFERGHASGRLRGQMLVHDS
jgi:hypothetical protein